MSIVFCPGGVPRIHSPAVPERRVTCTQPRCKSPLLPAIGQRATCFSLSWRTSGRATAFWLVQADRHRFSFPNHIIYLTGGCEATIWHQGPTKDDGNRWSKRVQISRKFVRNLFVMVRVHHAGHLWQCLVRIGAHVGGDRSRDAFVVVQALLGVGNARLGSTYWRILDFSFGG